MARMHTSDRGSSGSTRPVHPNTDFVQMDADEVKEQAQELAEKGHSQAEIGRILRDEYGIPSVKAVTGSKIGDIVEARHDFPEDIRSLMRKAISVKTHMEQHPSDMDAKRRLQLTEAKIRRLANYYRGDEIPADWKYNIEKARLIVE